MKPNELRKGNLIHGLVREDEEGNDINELYECSFLGYDPFEGNFWVDAVNEKEAREYYDEFQPIPITEEWLSKFGFESKGNYFSKGNFGFQKDHDLWQWHGIYLIQIKYIHQLQNLVHALTGEELELTSNIPLPTSHPQ